MKILIIDDNDLVRESTEQVLLKRGHLVLSASDGEQGLKIALEELPDRIICDFDMPGLNGAQVYAALSPELQERMWLWSAIIGPPFPRKDRIVTKPCSVKFLLQTVGIP